MGKNVKTETDEERELRWQTESDFDTLMSYEKLVKDPERLKRAKKLAKEKQNELSSLLSIEPEEEEA
jgi:cell shape-determining protein MreC